MKRRALIVRAALWVLGAAAQGAAAQAVIVDAAVVADAIGGPLGSE